MVLEFELNWDSSGPEDLLLTTRGIASAEGIAAYRQAINADARLRPDILILVDHRELDWSQMTSPQIRTESSVFQRDARPLGNATMAVVMGSTLDFGLMRMLHSQIPADVEIERAVFYSIEDARAWLAQRRVEPTAVPTSAAFHLTPGIA